MRVELRPPPLSPSLSVSDDELSLTPPNGHEAVHGLDSRLHGLTDRDTRDNTWGL